jgi:hypothetical protein
MMPAREKARVELDPQLDVNVIIQLQQGVPLVVTYARANQTAGLTYNSAARAEYLASASGTPA